MTNKGQPLILILILASILAGTVSCQPNEDDIVPMQPNSPLTVAMLPTETALPLLSPTTLPTLIPTIPPTPVATLPAPATATPLPTITPSPTPALTATPTPEPIIHLAAVGDIMLGRTLGQIISSGNITYPFAAVNDWLASPDLTIGNVESALGETGAPYPNKVYTFQAPPPAAAALAVAGFDVVSLANNHGMDYGEASLLEAIDLLRAQGVVPIGAGANRTAARQPYITTINGLTVGILAYVQVSPEPNGFTVESWDATDTTAGLAWARPDELQAEVSALSNQVDHVIVVLHSGIEYLPSPSEDQQALVDAALAGGATLIIGHHAHILQGIRYDETNKTLVAYGLGNFAFDIDGDPHTGVLHVWLSPEGVERVEFLPAVVQVGGAPRPAAGEEISEILQKVGRQSRGWQP